MIVDITRPSTWKEYDESLCQSCRAGCCQLPVELKFSELVRLGVGGEFESQEPRKKIAKRLKKEGIISHYHNKSEIYTLSQMSNGDCLYLDSNKRQCTMYENRPLTCRQHPLVGPRPGFCAYQKKK